VLLYERTHDGIPRALLRLRRNRTRCIACALRAKTFGRKAASYSVPHLFVRFESLAATT
jgi:hypothetical protein